VFPSTRMTLLRAELVALTIKNPRILLCPAITASCDGSNTNGQEKLGSFQKGEFDGV
jgi:hypothetical protein